MKSEHLAILGGFLMAAAPYIAGAPMRRLSDTASAHVIPGAIAMLAAGVRLAVKRLASERVGVVREVAGFAVFAAGMWSTLAHLHLIWGPITGTAHWNTGHLATMLGAAAVVATSGCILFFAPARSSAAASS